MQTIDREIDARGLNCPLPILRTKKALNDMLSGQRIRITATDPGQRARLPGVRAADRQRAARARRSRRRVLVRAEASLTLVTLRGNFAAFHPSPAAAWSRDRIRAAPAAGFPADRARRRDEARPCVRCAVLARPGAASSTSCCFPRCCFARLRSATMSLGDASRLVVVGVLFTLAGMALSALAKPLLHLPQPTFAACFQCAFRFNTYIALAAASRLGGAAAVAAISLLIGVLVPLVNVAAIACSRRPRQARVAGDRAQSARRRVRRRPRLERAGGPVARVRRARARAPRRRGIAARTRSPPVRASTSCSARCRSARLAGGTWSSSLRCLRLRSRSRRGSDCPPLERQVAVLLAAVPTAPSAYILACR